MPDTLSLNSEMKTEKDDLIYIRCSKATGKRFRRFVLESDAENYEGALVILLDRGEHRRIAVEPAGKP